MADFRQVVLVVVLVSVLPQSNALADEVDRLIARMTSETGTWGDRLAAEKAIVAMAPSSEMLERLFPDYEQFGGNSNPLSGTFQNDRETVPNQIGYLVRSSFSHHRRSRDRVLARETTAKLFHVAKQPWTQYELLVELYWNYSDDAEKDVVDYFLKNKDRRSAMVLVKWTNHSSLVLEQIEDKSLPQGRRDDLLRAFEGNVFKERLTVERQHRVIRDGFELLDEKGNDQYPGERVYLVRFLQDLVGQRFLPDSGLFKYRDSENRLNERFYRESYDNAHAWWEKNRQQFGPMPKSAP